MKTSRLLLLVLMTIPSVVTFGQKTLSLEDAVMKQWGSLAPDNIHSLQWVKGKDNYSFVEDSELIIGSLSGKDKTAITLEAINTQLDLGLKSFPRITWQDKYTFTFVHKNTLYAVNAQKKSARTVLFFREDCANQDLHYKGKVVAYTVENNLYVRDQNGEHQITDNPEGVVSGQAIARFEFGISKGTFWSPDGSKLAFYEKDESGVGLYPLVDYKTRPATVNNIRYPMAGTQGELAAVGIYHVSTGKTVYLQLENNEKSDAFYATNVGWDPNGESVFVAIINRGQDHMWLKKYDARTGAELQTLFEEVNDKYVEPERPPRFLPDVNNQFLWFSERNGIDNLYLYDTGGKLLGNTNFSLPVKRIIGFDKESKNVFVECVAGNPTEVQIFKVDLSTMKHQQITKKPGVHSAVLSSGGKFLIDRWSSVDVPRKIDLISTSGKMIKNMLTADNPLKDYHVSTPEIQEINGGQRGLSFWTRMIKPSDFDPRKQYPVLVYVYNGPHVQLVQNRWLGGAPLWMYHLAEEGYIVFTADGRGSSSRGWNFESAIHRQAGSVELDDQETCTNWLKAQPYTDADRFAVHGWSYGGFMTTSLMLKKPGLFKVGVAGGPVIDWSLYEIMYTERYMDTPEENPEGYEQADLKNYVENLEGDLLMIHGTVDDVVVMQHNMEFQKTCVDKGVQVDFYPYPGHPHNVRGKDRVHLMTKVLDYIKERL